MKIDREKIVKEINRIRHKGTLSYNMDSGEVTGPGDTSHLPPVTQGIIEMKKEDLERGRVSDLTGAEQQLASDMNRCWDSFEEKVLNVMEVFARDQKEEFFYAFRKLVDSLNRLWETAFFDMEALTCIFKFLEEADADRFEKVKDQLWFAMYYFTEGYEAMELNKHILSNDISPDFPFPGFYYLILEPAEED